MLTGLMAMRSSPLSLCPSPTLGWLLLSNPCTGGFIALCRQTQLLGPQMGAWPAAGPPPLPPGPPRVLSAPKTACNERALSVFLLGSVPASPQPKESEFSQADL